MSIEIEFNARELARRAYRNYLLKVRNWCVVLFGLFVFVTMAGIPHVQTTYTYLGERPRGGSPTATQKIDAWYFSVTGWQHVQSEQYGQLGCPVFLFIPVADCINWPNLQTKFPFSLFQGVEE